MRSMGAKVDNVLREDAVIEGLAHRKRALLYVFENR